MKINKMFIIYLFFTGVFMTLGIIVGETSRLIGVCIVGMIIFSGMAGMEWVSNWWKRSNALSEKRGEK